MSAYAGTMEDLAQELYTAAKKVASALSFLPPIGMESEVVLAYEQPVKFLPVLAKVTGGYASKPEPDHKMGVWRAHCTFSINGIDFSVYGREAWEEDVVDRRINRGCEDGPD